MMQKRTIYSLLLISFILVFALSLSAQEVIIPDAISMTRCTASSFDVTVDSPDALGAVEIVFEITGSGGAFFNAIDFVFDGGFAGITSQHVNVESNGTTFATVRILAMKASATDACLTAGTTVLGQLLFTTNSSCSGDVTISGGTFSCPTFSVETQFVDCTTNEFISVDIIGDGVVTFVNSAPTIEDISNVDDLPWGDPLTGVTAVGHDDDLLATTCESLTYSFVGTPPTGMNINSNTGSITWTPVYAQVGLHTVEVQVEDGCFATASDVFTVCVTNEAPIMDCPTETMLFALGNEVALTFSAVDPDDGPLDLVYTLIDFLGPGTPSLDDGEFTWQTMFDNSYKGFWDVTVVVTDGANTDPCSPNNSDTCTITIAVVNYLVTIESTECVIQGQEHTVDIYMQDAGLMNFPMGGFDFLIQYDNSALTFQYAEEGQFLTDCGWEYFTYRYGPNGNCGSACPTGEVRVVAIAETNDGGENHPDCFTNYDETISNQLVILHFLVTNDRTFECMIAPIQFVWYDCGDNTISSVDGYSLFISNNVYNNDDTTTIYGENIAMEDDFPTIHGANSSCDIETGQTPEEVDKPETMRFVDFVNGGICIICGEDIDDRGDLNMNGLPYEVADAVLYSRYFVYGLGVFIINVDGQIAASDVNADGLTLSVSDLVYLIRVVIGDANPYPKEVVPSNINFIHAENGTIALKSDIEIGAAHITMTGDVTPTLLANDMDMIYDFNGVNTNILVYSLDGNTFSGEMLQADGEIVSIDMADRDGIPVVAKWIPDNFGLSQNYPNPFNPTTTLSFQLPKASDYELTIYNVQGQKVQTFEGSHEAGVVNIEWDASNMASGIYFYRLNAENFSDTKKMVLLK